MNANGTTSIQESKANLAASTLMRLAGVSTLLAGLCFIIIGIFHQVNIPSSVTTATWVNVHLVAVAMGFFGLFGLAGLYARQAEESGWLGLAGFLLLSVWMVLMTGFSFVEAFVLPHLATLSPAFVESILGMLTGVPGTVELGLLPTLWNLSGLLIILGPLLFGIATFRAGVLPRWAGGLLALSAVLVPIGAAVPAEYQPEVVMIPIGLAFAWLGYALVSEPREESAESLLGQRTIQPEQGKAA